MDAREFTSLLVVSLEASFILVFLLVTAMSQCSSKANSMKRFLQLVTILFCGCLILIKIPIFVWETSTDAPLPESMVGVVMDYNMTVQVKNNLKIPNPLPISFLTGFATAVVRVEAGGVNPRDYKVHAQLVPLLRWFLPHQIGHDFSGVVVARTPGCKLNLNDQVFGSAITGAAAEFALIWCDGTVAKKPQEISFEEAAALPTAGRSAIQGLLRSKAIENPTILIVGASGGCGSIAVQYAMSIGANVIGICSAKNIEYVKGLGVKHVLDYTSQTFKEQLAQLSGKLDIVYDTVSSFEEKDYNYEPLLGPLLKPNGVYVSLNGSISDWIRAVASYITGFDFERQQYEIPLPPSNLTPFYEDLAELYSRVPLLTKITREKLVNGQTVYQTVMSRRATGKYVLIPDK